jgi:protease-4
MKGQGRGLLISLSIVAGIILACAILPLGAFALLLVAGASADTASGPLPERSWREQVISGSSFASEGNRVLLLNVNGVIGAPDAGVFGNTLSHRELLSQIDQATSDEQIAAVVVRVDSPGGGVVASSELHKALVDLRESGKRVVISMGSTAASGGYYIATAGERIYANADTLTGSLGVIISLLNYGEAFENLGLRQLVFKSGEFKDIGLPTRELTPEERDILQSIVDQAYEGFVDVIVEGRNLPREQVLELADGRIYTGEQALELDLVDELGGEDQAITAAKELAALDEDALVVRYNQNLSFQDLLLSSLEQSQRPADPLGLRTLTEPQQPRLEYRMVP